jgi:hypothetical protein
MGRTPHLLVPDDIDPTDYEVSVSVMVFNTTFNNISPVLKISTYIITDCPIGLAAIIVTMSVSTFKTAIILYLFQQYVTHLIVGQ